MADTTGAAETEQHTGVGVFLIPAEADPIVAASSEPAHLTTVWMGSMENIDDADLEALKSEVEAYAAGLDGPVVVPTAGRGVLGDDQADVTFLERTDALLALRDGLLEGAPTAEKLMNAVEQYPEWTPHVTMGYPETPALAEYDGDAVTFDRVGVWIGPDQHEYPMGGAMSEIDQLRARAAALTAAAAPADPATEAPDDEEMPADELDDGEEELIEIPVHGVATLEGKPTGDGRGFRPGALSFGRLPAPLGYEFEHGHGSSNSRVAVIGRIDEFWTVPSPTEGEGVFEVRWRGVIDITRDYAAQAVQGIVDGSYDGVSIVIDAATRDVSEARDTLRAQIEADRAGEDVMANMSVDEILDSVVGDGTQDVTWWTAARIRRFDMVPTGAFEEGYTALGSEFADELTDEQLAIAASALADCGCAETEQIEALIASARQAYRAVSTEERKKLADEGDAMPDGSFPIANVDDLRNAIQSIGRAKDPKAARAHIRKRARDLGQEELIPDGWSVRVGDFAPGTHDGPGWITHPNATARIRRYWVRGKGAGKIAWGTPGDFNRCRAQLVKYVQNPDWLAGLCANMHKEAMGVWPGQEAGGRKGNRGHHALVAGATPAPLFTITAAVEPLDAAFFRRRELPNPRVGLVVDGDAVYGYIAQWNVCHIGNPQGPNVCTLAPHSKSNYGLFRTGSVMTTEGPVAVGQITMGIGHADAYDNARVAASHYDNTNAAVADIACGEDNFGIWFAGKLRPTATDQQRFDLAASGRLSGDWRPFGSDYELIAALAVNVPGYPIPEVAIAASAEGHVTAILAAGIVRPEEVDEPYVPEIEGSATLSTTDIAGIAIAAAETVLAKFAAGGIVPAGGELVNADRGYVVPLLEDVAEDEQPITPDLAAARNALRLRLLADARSAAATKGI